MREAEVGYVAKKSFAPCSMCAEWLGCKTACRWYYMHSCGWTTLVKSTMRTKTLSPIEIIVHTEQRKRHKLNRTVQLMGT